MINLTIKTLDSQDHKFRVPDTFTILELKEHIAEQVNIAVCQQRLIFCGRVMSNETKLADIGIDGKVMHLVQKVPRLATTTSGTTSSTTTNTNSRSGQNGGPGFRGWHTHDPTVLFGAIGIPSEFMHAGELPRLLSASARSHGAGNRVALAIDMIRRANEVLNRLENPQTAGRSTANEGEQLPEESQQTEESSRNVPLEPSLQESPVQESPAQESASQEPSSIPTQSDSDSLNVSYEVDETFPNTVVVTIDATHHMRMPPGLMRHMQSHMQGNNSHSPSQNLTEHTVESEVIPELITVGSSNQPSADQATRTSSANSEQNVRNDRQTSERSSAAINDRRRLRELIEQLNSLNARLQPFYAQYCQYINDDPHFETTIGDNGSQRAQIVFNGVSEVMHFISHIYHAISDLRVAFNRPPPRSFQSRPCLLQGTILHTAHSVTTTTSNAAPSPAPSSQQPTSTQTTTTNQSIPSVRALRVDFMNPEGVVRNVSTSATSTETNTNMTVDPNTDNNSTATEFSSETPHGVELMFDLTPGSIRIDSVEAAFVNPNASGSSQPTAVSQPPSGGEHSNNTPMQSIDWMDQMIDVISSGVRRPFMPDQPVDWSIPTTSTRTPRVTPRTTDSSSTTNPPSQGLSRGRWDSSPRMDPFLPCSSHHFESNVRPMVLARRSPQMTDRSTSGNASTTDTSSPTPPNVTRTNIRRPTERILERHRARYMQDSEGFLSGIHPILTWGRNHRNNTATTPASNNVPTTGQSNVADALAGQIRVDMESVLDTLGREVDFERVTRSNMQPPSSSGSDSSVSPVNQSGRRPDEMLMTSIGDIPYFRSLEGRYVLVDLFLLITRNWTLHDMLNLCTSELSTLRQHPVSRISESLVDFVLDRVMINQPPTNLNIEAAANRIYLEMVPYINIFQCSVPTRTNIDVNASFRQCILLNMRALVNFCDENRAGASNDIVAAFTIFAEGVLSLIVYCCNNRSVFRLCIAAVMQFLPLPTNLHRFIMELVRQNIDQYWDNMTTFQMMSLSVIDFIVPFNTELESGQSSRGTNDEHSSQSSQSSSPILPSPDNINEPLPEVVIGSQEWHHGVPSEWVPVIARDSQRQRRQGTQPPYSDAYLSGMPNKRRKIVTSSKPQGSLPQMIASSLENAMGAAGVVVKKELTKSVGADTAVQNAYTERVRKCGRSGLDMHPDFCPDRYPNASKFFYNRPN